MIGKLDRLVASANEIIRANAGLRVNQATASHRTQEISEQIIGRCCRQLHALGFYIEDISGLQRKHIDALLNDWHSTGLSAKTIQNQFSRLKIFCGWMGKGGIVSPEGAIGHLPGVDPKSLRVRTVADRSKSWSANGLDIAEKIRQARNQDPRHGAMLLLGVAFGLRKKEMLRIKPWKADKGDRLEIDGAVAKNGKHRVILIERGDPERDEFGRAQRWALDLAKSLCKKNETLGWPGLSIKQAENRYYHYMKVLGITKFDAGVSGHGLRAEYAENMLILRGLMPPTLGGNPSQASPAERDRIMLEVQNKLGHDDRHASGAYWGSFRRSSGSENLGTRIGPVLVVDGSSDTFAMLYCDPPPIKEADGTYKTRSGSQRRKTMVTAVVEKAGRDDDSVELEEFVNRFPHLEGKVRAQLAAVGVGGPAEPEAAMA